MDSLLTRACYFCLGVFTGGVVGHLLGAGTAKDAAVMIWGVMAFALWHNENFTPNPLR